MDLQRIVTFIGLGDIRFGMNRSDLREIFQNKYKTFSRDRNEDQEIDSYDIFGLQLNFDDQDKLEFIEAFYPSNPMYDGITFIGRQANSIQQEMSNKGFKTIQDDVGYDFPDLGFGVYVREGTIEAVSIYRRGYYDH
nr:hypothetical protein [uncultured Desulfobulbus sp.]